MCSRRGAAPAGIPPARSTRATSRRSSPAPWRRRSACATARADTKALFRAGDEGWGGLADVDFRVGRFGRLEFTHDGEAYGIQYMPAGMQELVAPPELMLAQMMNAGVDHCVLQAGGGYGAMTEMNADSGRRYPGRMTGLMHVDEAMAGRPAQLAEIDHAFTALGLRGLYFNVDSLSRHGFPWPLDAPEMEPFWDKLVRRGIALCLEFGSGPGYDMAGYMAHIVAFGRVLDRYPTLRVHLAMSPPVAYFAPNGRYDFPTELRRLYRHEKLVLEVVFPITYGGVWDYPYPEAQALIADMRDQLGADRLVWGSDMPNVERFCTYKQSLDYIRRYCPFLTAREKDLILGDTCAAFYGIDGAAA
ncbi:MAG: amidohydrolase [Rhodospirillales bacterium]|nr:MAG: amidohydrolase [Rhodospirillales bacterium]